VKINTSKIKRILLITLSNIGDAILTTPVLDALIRNFPHARIDLFISPAAKEIFEKDKRISKIFLYDKHSRIFEKYRLLKKLNKLKYNLIVDLKHTMIPVFLFPTYRTNFLRGEKDVIHKKNEHLKRIKELGLDTKEAKLKVEILAEDKKSASSLLNNRTKSGKYIIINAGAKSHVKRWPVKYFAKLCDRIIEELGYEVVLIGKDGGLENPDSDRVVVNNLLGVMKEKALDLVGKTNIRELAYLIGNAKLLITNDSAPLHIASAVNTPTVAMFGPTDERKYGPLAEKNTVLRKKLECAPCEKAQCRYSYECLEKIRVEDVFKAVKGLCGY